MSLFQTLIKIIQSHCPKNKTANKSQIAPLQVRNCCIQTCHKKGTLSWGSCQVQGSLSLEAAMCLSLFLFLCVCLMMPMKMMDRQRRIQGVMEAVGEELSQYAYVEYCFRSFEEAGLEVDTGRGGEGDYEGGHEDGHESGGVSLLAAGYAAVRIMEQIDSQWVESVSFAGTDIGGDDMVHIVMKYRMRLPFTVLGVRSIPVEQVCSRRMWTGAQGGRYDGNGTDDKIEEEEVVFIGKNSTRYHRLRTCHYLYNDLREVSVTEADAMRNQSGSRYTPCHICGFGKGSTVYIMPYGTSYHRSRTCSSIIAYVQAVPLSQVEHLGECSYCKGR